MSNQGNAGFLSYYYIRPKGNSMFNEWTPSSDIWKRGKRPQWIRFQSSSFENVMPEVNIDLFVRKAVSLKVKIIHFVNTDYRKRNWVFAMNLQFLTPISLQPDDVNLWYFKLRLFNLTELIA